jgi:phospholipase C
MRFTKILLLSVTFVATLAHAQIHTFPHIIVVVQENRTPDNLFGGSTGFIPQTWDIHPDPNGVAVTLISCINPDHSHGGFNTDAGGNWNTGEPCTSIQYPQKTVVGYTSVVPYVNIGQYYGFANRMFQTNQGPSFPAHQFLLSATSAPTSDTTDGNFVDWFVAENPPQMNDTGCTALQGVVAKEIDPSGHESSGYTPPLPPSPAPDPGYPCYEHPTLTDLLDHHHPKISWKFYAPNAKSIWTAPNSIYHVCLPVNGVCTGDDWVNNILSYLGHPTKVLDDINNPNCAANALAQVSWVIPSQPYSDHGGLDANGYGPYWVANIVNAVGNSPCGYWNNTAILITWDDWGGFYDHVPLHRPFRNQYELGFRVPLLVVSAYTDAGSVSCPAPVGQCQYDPLDFGSILLFIESNFGLPFIAPQGLNYADEQAIKLDPALFSRQTPRTFQPIPNITYDSAFFTNNVTPDEDPDDD